jgi:hypothetical protein
MPFFLLHQPVILAIAFPVVRWDAGIPLKLAVVLLGSFAVSAALAVAVTRLRHVSALFGVKPRSSAEWPVAGGTIGPGSPLPRA